MRLLPYGDRGLLVELADTAAVVAVAELVRAHPLAGELVADVVPGARTVLLVARPGVAVGRLVDVAPDERAVAEAVAQPIRQVRREKATYQRPVSRRVRRPGASALKNRIEPFCSPVRGSG